MSSKLPKYYPMSELHRLSNREAYRRIIESQFTEGTGWIRIQIRHLFHKWGSRSLFAALDSTDGIKEIIRIIYQTTEHSQQEVTEKVLIIKGEIDRMTTMWEPPSQLLNQEYEHIIDVNDIEEYDLN